MSCTLIGIAGVALVLWAFRANATPEPEMIPIPVREVRPRR